MFERLMLSFKGLLKWEACVAFWGEGVSFLALRLILAVEFGTAGLEKFHGENWFYSIQENFPFPFNIVPANISWFMATYFEIFGALFLIFGLMTRFVSVSLMVLTVVAVIAVHLPSELVVWTDIFKGYAISDDGFGNYKLPLFYMVMFLPLLFKGSGVLGLDFFARKWLDKRLNA